jgi:hypothetical protein
MVRGEDCASVERPPDSHPPIIPVSIRRRRLRHQYQIRCTEPACHLQAAGALLDLDWLDVSSRPSARQEHAPPEQVKIGAAKHEALNELYLGDLPLNLAAVPLFGQCRPCRVLISVQACHKPAHLRNLTGLRCLLPCHELLVTAGAQQVAETRKQLMRGADLVVGLQQSRAEGWGVPQLLGLPTGCATR